MLSKIAQGYDVPLRTVEAAHSAARGADVLVIATEWEQFRPLDPKRLKKAMGQPVIVNQLNIYRPEEMVKHGFIYEGIGRPLMTMQLVTAKRRHVSGE
jgi:UDPglucose 6-dehydrogenase